jgi:O-acetyl-ADP-ribose deacetylase (regulator of RNase III)
MLRAASRRPRRPDPLARPQAIRSVFAQLRAALPEIIPTEDKDLIRMLRAARHIQRYVATETRRGRPSPWQRQDLLRMTAVVLDILDRETSSGLSLSSFVDHYLRVLNFPAEVVRALSKGEVNLFEAQQLARITPARLGISAEQARRKRAEMLSTHVQARLSGERLRQRVNEILRTSAQEAEGAERDAGANVVTEADLEDFDPYDPTHLFWDQIKQMGFALKDIKREDVSEADLEELLKATEPVLTILARIQRRKERKVVMKMKI